VDPRHKRLQFSQEQRPPALFRGVQIGRPQAAALPAAGIEASRNGKEGKKVSRFAQFRAVPFWRFSGCFVRDSRIGCLTWLQRNKLMLDTKTPKE